MSPDTIDTTEQANAVRETIIKGMNLKYPGEVRFMAPPCAAIYP